MKNIVNVYEAVDANRRKSVMVMVGFVVFVAAVAYVLAAALGYGLSFVGWALILSGAMSFFSYYFSDRVVLAISGAKPANRKEFFDYYTVVENLAMAAQIPKPRLYVIPDSAMNAFATGRDPEHAVVCATTGLLERLNRTELEGVMAHELSHIRGYDIRLMGIVTVLAGIVTLLADWFLRASFWGRREREEGNVGAVMFIVGLVLAMLSPLVATLIKLAISRRREYLADAAGVQLTRFPEGLARALEKLVEDKEPLEAANKATAHLYIVNPLRNRRDAIGWFAGLFNTHPPVSERIKRLKEMV